MAAASSRAARWPPPPCSPGCRVIGVEPEAGDDGQRSFREGRIVTIPVPRTIADGAQSTALGDLTFAITRSHVADILTVTDDLARRDHAVLRQAG